MLIKLSFAGGQRRIATRDSNSNNSFPGEIKNAVFLKVTRHVPSLLNPHSPLRPVERQVTPMTVVFLTKAPSPLTKLVR